MFVYRCMYVYWCMYIYMHAYLHSHMYVYVTHIHTYTHTHTNTHAHTHIHIHIHAHTYFHTHRDLVDGTGTVSLNTLCVCKCDMTVIGAKLLLEASTSTTSPLRRIDLSYNTIGSCNAAVSGGAAGSVRCEANSHWWTTWRKSSSETDRRGTAHITNILCCA